MNLRATLRSRPSKEEVLDIVHWIGNDKSRLKELWELVEKDEEQVIRDRGAWALHHTLLKSPDLTAILLSNLVFVLEKEEISDTVKRNVVSVLQHVNFPEELLGPIATFCFTFLSDPKESIAVRAFSMTVLHQVCQQVPELSEELKIGIEEVLPHGTAAIRSRGKKILKALNKA